MTPCGVTGTSKFLEHGPSQKLELYQALGDQGFMLLIKVVDQGITCPAHKAAKLAVRGQGQFQVRQSIQKIAKAKPEQLFQLLLRLQN